MDDDHQHDAERSALEKLAKLISDEGMPVFSKEEAAALQKFAQIMLALSTFGSVGNVIKNLLVWVGLLIALTLAIKSGHILDFFTGQAKP